MRQPNVHIVRNRFAVAVSVLAAALVVGACQPPTSKTPAGKPAVDTKAPPAQAKSAGASEAVAQAPPDAPQKSEKAATPDERATQAVTQPAAELVEKRLAPRPSAETEEELQKAKEVSGGFDSRGAAETALGTQKLKTEEPSVEKSSPADAGKAPEATAPAAKEEKKDDDDEGAFSLKELEANRKLIEKEMAKEAARRAEEQKKRIAELGAPLVDNVDKLIRLDKVFPVWADPQHKRVVMVGEICQRQVPLEMFACTRHTKEHEAIVVVDTKAQIVHAGLLAVGARPGRPVQFGPNNKYVPASGQEIEVTLVWKDAKGKKHSARGQDWVRHVRTKKAMEYPWVFAGSGFTKDEYTGKTYYLADGGDFICVSNFSTAMLDIPVESSSVNAELEFEAFTERIPEVGTPVTMILTPKRAPKPTNAKKGGTDAPSKPQGKKTAPEKPKS